MGWLAKRTGRAVRWSETRSENMTGMLQGRAQLQTVTIGGTRDGRVLAYRLDVLADAGAYPRLGAFLPYFTRVDGARGVRHPAGRVAAPASSRPPRPRSGPTAAPGRPEATAAIERAMDLFAAEIGDGPRRGPQAQPHPARRVPVHDQGRGDLRQRRVREGARPGARRRGLRGAARRAGRAPRARRRRPARHRPRQRSSRSPAAAPFAEDATVEVHPDGTVTVLTGTSPHGQGHATAWAMLASEQLGIPIEMITVRHGDTDLVPRGAGTMGSRSLQTGGVAVHQAAVELVELARQRAADVLEADGRRPRGRPRARCAVRGTGRRGRARPARRDRAAADGGDVRLRRPHVPVRRAPRRRRGRHRDRQGGRRPDRHRRRRRAGAQPAARRGPAARRHRPGHRPGAVRGGRATTPTATR